ncbi:unnamed protein product [Lactuca saligna]|uniref:Uncharacterized protein n=1 Tax=Lactuca saligna TaxID=75948 RepID=A0AA35Z3J1_LACSI|nr:unnamed protein product [Lactuca saligna]
MLPPVKRSPFVIREVPIDTTLTKEENIISNWNPGYMHVKGTKSEEEYKNFKENVLQCLGVSEDRRCLKGFDMKYMFGRYLLEINHNMAFSVQYEIDFLIRGPLAQWECGFKKEGANQLHQTRKLRRRYCLKILLSEVNIMKPEVENLIGQYQRMSHDDRRKLYLDGIVKIGSRLATFGP